MHKINQFYRELHYARFLFNGTVVTYQNRVLINTRSKQYRQTYLPYTLLACSMNSHCGVRSF
jgi:hypothetical protein